MKKTINYFIMAVSAVAMLIFIGSCSKSNNSLPPIAGYNSSDDVGKDNLVSYFPFDGNADDSKNSSAKATEVGVTYTSGLRGQAYQGATGAYATVAPSAAYSSLPSYTISFWYKISAHPDATSGPEGIFFLSGTKSNSTSDYEPANGTELIFEIENNGSTVGSDSLLLHNGFTNLASTGWQGFTMGAWSMTDYKSWIHIVATYDGGSSTYVIYQNGQAILNQSTGDPALSNVLYQGDHNADPTVPPQGNLSWTPDPPKQITIGTWPVQVYGVSTAMGANGCFLGQLDEFRIYNTVLSPSDVGALYQLGSAGR